MKADASVDTCAPRPAERGEERRHRRRPTPPDPPQRVAIDPSVLGLRGPPRRLGAPDRRHLPHPHHGVHQRPVQPVEQRVLQRAAGAEPVGVLQPARARHLAHRGVHPARGLPALPQPDAPDPLAALADGSLSARVARRRRLLPHAARSPATPTIPTSESRRTFISSSRNRSRCSWAACARSSRSPRSSRSCGVSPGR